MAVVYTAAISIIAGVEAGALFTSYVGFLSVVLFIALIFLFLRRKQIHRLQTLLCIATFFFVFAMFPLYFTELMFDGYSNDFGEECIIHGRVTEIEEGTEPHRIRATVKLLKLKNNRYHANHFFRQENLCICRQSRIPGCSTRQ